MAANSLATQLKHEREANEESERILMLEVAAAKAATKAAETATKAAEAATKAAEAKVKAAEAATKVAEAKVKAAEQREKTAKESVKAAEARVPAGAKLPRAMVLSASTTFILPLMFAIIKLLTLAAQLPRHLIGNDDNARLILSTVKNLQEMSGQNDYRSAPGLASAQMKLITEGYKVLSALIRRTCTSASTQVMRPAVKIRIPQVVTSAEEVRQRNMGVRALHTQLNLIEQRLLTLAKDNASPKLSVVPNDAIQNLTAAGQKLMALLHQIVAVLRSRTPNGRKAASNAPKASVDETGIIASPANPLHLLAESAGMIQQASTELSAKIPADKPEYTTFVHGLASLVPTIVKNAQSLTKAGIPECVAGPKPTFNNPMSMLVKAARMFQDAVQMLASSAPTS